MQPDMDDVGNVETAAVRFERDGYVLVRDRIPNDLLDEWLCFSLNYVPFVFQRLLTSDHTILEPHCSTSDRDKCKKYPLGLGVKNGFREIVMRSPGRYEIALINANNCSDKSSESSSMLLPKSPTMPKLDPIKQHLSDLIRAIFHTDGWPDLKICSVSLVISTPGSPEQTWHADGGHLSLEEHLPCHVMNIFVPLEDVPIEKGPTEFRPGTHYHTRNLAPMMLAARARKTLRAPETPTLRAGDTLLFDYRILHRGKANLSSSDRIILVFTVSKPWFSDKLNFPKRSIEDLPRR